MRSAPRGRNISSAEVTNVSANGFWLLLDDRELFVSFSKFPWFREATVGQILNVARPSAHHLYWAEIDVDLAVDSIEHPERYPLVSRVRPNKALQRPVSRVTALAEKRKGRPARPRR